MKKLKLNEVKKYTDNEILLYNTEIGNIEFYLYENPTEEAMLLKRGYCVHSKDDKVIGVRKTEKPLGRRPKEKPHIYRLVQDASDKLGVKIERETLSYEIKKYFRWRKGDMIERFFSQGTLKHDAFIAHLVSKGF